MNRNNLQKQDPLRLSKEQLRNSRAGRLGRFPSEDLYEPEPTDDTGESIPSRTIRTPSREHEETRKRSAAVRLE